MIIAMQSCRYLNLFYPVPSLVGIAYGCLVGLGRQSA